MIIIRVECSSTSINSSSLSDEMNESDLNEHLSRNNNMQAESDIIDEDSLEIF